MRGRERGQHLDYALENKENVEATYGRYFWVIVCRELYISALNISVLFFFGNFCLFVFYNDLCYFSNQRKK